MEKIKLPSWPEAIKVCRLNANDVTMAKRLGYRPDSLIRAKPRLKDKWKVPVSDWVCQLHRELFGHVIGEKPGSTPAPVVFEFDEEAPGIGMTTPWPPRNALES